MRDVREIRLWGLLRLNPLSQAKYIRHQGVYRPDIEYYAPRYNRITRPNGLRKTIVVPTLVYPGYLFVRLDCDLRDILDGPVRVYFVRFGGHIGLVREEVMDRLKKMEALQQLVKEEVKDNPYKPGRNIRVHTPVASIAGILVMCTQSHTRAIVDTVMGHWDVPIHQVELV